MIKIWRSFLVVISFVFFGAGSLLLSIIVFPFLGLFVKNEKKRECFSNIIHELWRFFVDYLIFIKIINVKIIGDVENIRGKIIAASHPSLIDIVILVSIFPNSLCLAKKELMDNFFLKNIIKNIYIINDIDIEEFKKETTEALAAGYNIIIFPAGTRSEKGKDLKIHKGSALIQMISGADILPVVIDCDYDFLQKDKPIYLAGNKTVNYNLVIKDEIKLTDFDNRNYSEIKLRQVISSEIKNRLTS